MEERNRLYCFSFSFFCFYKQDVFSEVSMDHKKYKKWLNPTL